MENIVQINGATYLVLDYDTIKESHGQNESNSVFNRPEPYGTYHLVGRYHEGDENGTTKCKFGNFKIPDKYKDRVRIFVGCGREVKVKESESNITCASGEVIISRKHEGDENGYTYYLVAEVTAEVDGVMKSCKTTNTELLEIKESSGKYAYIKNKCIVARNHHGDENANTRYTFGKIAVPIDNP